MVSKRGRMAWGALAAVLVLGGTAQLASPSATAATPAPKITTITPTSGPKTGGTVVSVTGLNFTGTSAVKFGTKVATFTLTSSTSLTTTAPSGTGTVDIRVTTPGGTSVTGAADKFTYVADTPVVSAISPTSGPKTGGTVVSVSGTNFVAVSAVKFGSKAATSFTVDSATSLTATAPSGSGTVDVHVSNASGTSGTSSADKFIYLAIPAPKVTAISPTSGPKTGGTMVNVSGLNFSGATAVKFGTKVATFTLISSTSLTTTAPSGTGTVDIRVTTPGGTSVTGAADKFTYLAIPAPKVTAISPTSGLKTGGTMVSVSGLNFSGASAVKFGTKVATFTLTSSTSLTTTAPSGTGTVDIRVTTPGGTSVTGAADKFTYTTTTPVPVVTSLSPDAGPTTGGTVVTISGSGLSAASAVKFGTAAASGLNVVSDSQISATAPAENAGTVDVTVTTPGGTSATGSSDQFTYQSVHSCTITWTGATSSDWSTGSNWDSGSPPGSSDDVCIPATSSNLPVVLSNSATISTIANAGGVDENGTLDLTGTSSTSPGALYLRGQLTLSGSMTVTGTFTDRGAIDGSGSVTVPAGATFDNGGNARVQGTATLDLEGTSTWEVGSILLVEGGANLVNSGTIAMAATSWIQGGCAIAATPTSPAYPAGQFTNTGAITITDTTGFEAGIGWSPTEVGEDDNPACLVTNDTGSISLTSGSSFDAGAIFNLDAGGNISGPSNTTLATYGQATFADGSSITGINTLNANGTTVSVPVLPMGTIFNSGDLTDGNSPVVIATLNNGGDIIETSSMTVTGTFTDRGAIDGSGSVTVPAGATFDNGGNARVQGTATLDLEGTSTWEVGSILLVEGGANLVNSGTIAMAATSWIQGGCAIAATPTSPAYPAGQFTNTGAITITDTTGFEAGIGWSPTEVGEDDNPACLVTNDTGSISLTSGSSFDAGAIFNLDAGGNISGPSNTTLATYGQATFADGSSITGINTLNANGTTVSVPVLPMGTIFNSGDLTDGNSPVVIATLNNGGDIIETSSMTVTGTFTDRGAIDGSGSVTVPAGATFDNGGNARVQGTATLDLEGTSTWEVGSILLVEGGANLVNSGTIAMAATSWIQGGCAIAATPTSPAYPAGQFTNTGAITITDTTGFEAGIGWSPTEVGEDDNPACLVTNDTGSISLTSGSSFDAGAIFNLDAGGNISGPSNTTLATYGQATFADGSSITGINTLNANGTTVSVPVLPMGTIFNSGDLTDGNSPVVIATLNNGGDIIETSSMTVTGTFTDRGAIDGSGSVTVPAGATFDNGGNARVQGTATLDLEGTSTWEVGSILLVEGGANLVNSGTIAMAATSWIQGGCAIAATPTSPAYPAGQFTNTGAITITDTTGFEAGIGWSPTEVGEDDNPACLVTNDTGSISLTSGSSFDAGAIFNLDAGGNISGGSTTTLYTYGTFRVHNSRTLPVSKVSLSGTLELLPAVVVHLPAGSTLGGALEFDADAPGTFGELVANSPASLSNLSLEPNPSYTPVCGSSITALVAPSISGSWAGVFGPLPPGGSWAQQVTSTTAGAFIYCPPPSQAAAQTFGNGSSYDATNASGYFAEPVNTGTGAYTTTETDAKVAGLGVPFSFTRSYTSADTATGPLGTGWTDSMNVTASASGSGPGSTVTIADENGAQVTYTESAAGAYSGPAGTRSVLQANPGGGWVLTRHNQDRLSFDAFGRLSSEVDRNGVGLTFAYVNGSTQLASVTDFAGRVVTFTYNAQGLLAQMSLPLSRTVTYAYNASGQLTSVTDAAGGVTTYAYNAAGLLASVTDQNGHQEVANTYDGSGRVVSQVNALGQTASFSYSGGTTTYTDPSGGHWQDLYQNNVLTERIDPLAHTTTYSYDSNLDRTAVTDPDAHTTTTTYDAAGNMTSKTSALGITQSWTYDALNDVTGHTDGNANTTTYAYDARGDRTQMVAPGGATTTYVPDPSTGADTSITDPNGHTSTATYNAQGELTAVTSPLGEETTYTYDGAGRRITMVDARGNATGGNPSAHTTTYAYDALDRRTSVTDPLGHTTATTYDGVGNKTSATDANGHATTYSYDAADHLTAVAAPGGATTTSAYDANGNKVSVTSPLGHTTTSTYDAANRRTKSTDALGASTTYAYDAAGNKTSVTDALGATTTYAYDADNRLTGISYSDGTHPVTYAYDDADNPTQMTDGTGTTTYTYNTRNELTQVAGPGGTFPYDRDAAGNVTTRSYPDGTAVTYTYNADNKAVSVSAGSVSATLGYDGDQELTSITNSAANGYSENIGYDNAGRVSMIADTKGASILSLYSYSYDSAGNPTTVAEGAESDTFTYDTRDRLTAACYGSSCAAGHITYTLDADGNRTSLTTGSGTTTSAYNADDELTSTSGAISATYTYNADGERTAKGTTSYAWNAAGELKSITDGSGTTTYAYDGDGNRASATSGSSTTTYLYDLNNALPTLALEKNAGTVADRYIYADGLVLSADVAGSDYYLAHDAQGSVVGVTSAVGATESTTTYDPYGNVRSTNAVSGAPSIPLAYDAELLDPSGLYHLGARQLDPSTGSFLSEDPLSAPQTTPATSPYLYVGDQPTTLWDPSGLSSVTDQIGRKGPGGGSGASGAYESAFSTGFDIATSPESTPGWLSGAGNGFEGASDLYTVYKINSRANQFEQAANQDLNSSDASISSYEDYGRMEANPLAGIF